jgi:hypothetical protein
MLGLTPAALSHGIGADTQKPLAIVVIGGALILALIPRLIQPPLLVLAHQRDKRWKNRPPGGGPPPVTEGRPSGTLSAIESDPSPLHPSGV